MENQKCGGRRSCRPKHIDGLASCRRGAALPLPAPRRKGRKREKKRKLQQCHVLLHHWIGLEDSGPTSDERSHMPLGCVPFCWAQLASAHPCNYLYSICVQGIVQSTLALRNYGENNKTAAVITVICKLQEAANFPCGRQVRSDESRSFMIIQGQHQ